MGLPFGSEGDERPFGGLGSEKLLLMVKGERSRKESLGGSGVTMLTSGQADSRDLALRCSSGNVW